MRGETLKDASYHHWDLRTFAIHREHHKLPYACRLTTIGMTAKHFMDIYRNYVDAYVDGLFESLNEGKNPAKMLTHKEYMRDISNDTILKLEVYRLYGDIEPLRYMSKDKRCLSEYIEDPFLFSDLTLYTETQLID